MLSLPLPRYTTADKSQKLVNPGFPSAKWGQCCEGQRDNCMYTQPSAWHIAGPHSLLAVALVNDSVSPLRAGDLSSGAVCPGPGTAWAPNKCLSDE